MSALDLDAIEARAAAATPGPWSSDNFEVYPSEGGPNASCENGCDGGCDDDERAPIQCARVSHATEVIADVYGLQQFADQDGAFIAHARTDVPALCSSLRAARAALAERAALLAEARDLCIAVTMMDGHDAVGAEKVHHGGETQYLQAFADKLEDRITAALAGSDKGDDK